MPNNDDHRALIAVLEQRIKDLERRVAGGENTARVLMLLVLTTVIGTILKAVGVAA